MSSTGAARARVWGQALIDNGYQQGSCDHLYRTAQFRGKVTFVEDQAEKIHALEFDSASG
jgi:hypothetical protein